MRIRAAAVAVAVMAVTSCEDDDNKHPVGDGGVDVVADVSAGDVFDAELDAVPAVDAVPDGPSALTLSDRSCPDILKQASFPTFELQIDQAEWSALQDEFSGWQQRQAAGLPIQPFHPAVFKLGAETVSDAEVRLTGPTWTWTGKKMPLLVAFDRKNPAGTFHGLRGIELQAPPQDRSLMRNRLALAVLRSAGIPAQCAGNASVIVNGTAYGVFATTEPLDQAFVERNFPGAATGNLLAYGWNPVNGPMASWTRLEQLNAAKDVGTLERLVDLEASVREWAWEAVMPQGNGFWGVGQSHALYDHPIGGFQYIPYDFSIALEVMPTNAHPIYWTGAWVVGPPDKLLAVLHDPAWGQKFATAVAGATAEYVPATLKSWIDAWETQIVAAVDQDPNKGFTTGDHANAVVELRAYVSRRASYLATWNQCMAGTAQVNDSDKDGVPWCRDCNDRAAAVHPGVAEICGNHVDDDCSGRIDDGCPGVDGGWVAPPQPPSPTDAGQSD